MSYILFISVKTVLTIRLSEKDSKTVSVSDLPGDIFLLYPKQHWVEKLKAKWCSITQI